MISLPWSLSGLAIILLAGCHAAKSNIPPAAATQSTNAMTTVAAPPRHVLLPAYVAQGLGPGIDVLRSARLVESYRIQPVPREDASQGILGYPIIAAGPKLDEATSRQLRSLILDPRGYNGELWCGDIQPGVAFRFVGDGHILTVLICFKCQEWEFWLDGKRAGKDWFIGLQPELLRLVQHVFPSDESLAAIAPSETYGRIYWIKALLTVPAELSDARRGKIIAEWTRKVMDAVGGPADWRDAGGSKHSLRVTEDGAGLIVITTAKGHAAIASLDGIEADHN